MKLLIALFTILISQTSSADTPASVSIEKIYSFEQIEQVANYLGAKAENPKTKILSCDESAEKSTQILSGQVRSLLDSKKAEELEKLRKDPKAYIAKVKDCSLHCTCNGYNLLVDDQGGSYKELDALLADETKKQTADQSLKCAKKLSWYCKSKLRTYLLQ